MLFPKNSIFLVTSVRQSGNILNVELRELDKAHLTPSQTEKLKRFEAARVSKILDEFYPGDSRPGLEKDIGAAEQFWQDMHAQRTDHDQVIRPTDVPFSDDEVNIMTHGPGYD